MAESSLIPAGKKEPGTMVSTRIRLAAVVLALMGVVMRPSAHADATSFRIWSHDIVGGQFQRDQILSRAFGLGCDGGNLSPHLDWEGAPDATQSFVLTVFDQDAQNGKGWFHWLVVNIPDAVNSLPRGAGGDGAVEAVGALQIRNDFGQPSYGGPCPPPGQTHRYVVTLTALKIAKLPIDRNATPAMVDALVQANKLAAASFTATYAR
jgi:Raf kinase inhibitor-like YbhB/YbcL family protein